MSAASQIKFDADSIIARYRSGESMQKIGRSLHTADYRISRLLHRAGVRVCEMCANGCDEIVYSHGLCRRCYFNERYAKKHNPKPVDPNTQTALVLGPDKSFILMYKAGMSIKTIAKRSKSSYYIVKQHLQDAGLIDAVRCSTPGCESVACAKGFCRKCYNNRYRKSNHVVPEVQAWEIHQLIQKYRLELKHNKTLYGCYTMAVPLHVRVDKHNDIVWLETEIKKLEAAEQN